MIDSSFWGWYFRCWSTHIRCNEKSNTCYKISVKTYPGSVETNCYLAYVNFSLLCLNNNTEMLGFKWNEKVTRAICELRTKKRNLVQHSKRCSNRKLYCTICPISSTRCQANLSFHMAKKHSTTETKNVQKCHPCGKDFPSFYVLRWHRQMSLGASSRSEAIGFDIRLLLGEVDDQSLQKELKICKHYLDDSEMENGRHRNFNFQWIFWVHTCRILI